MLRSTLEEKHLFQKKTFADRLPKFVEKLPVAPKERFTEKVLNYIIRPKRPNHTDDLEVAYWQIPQTPICHCWAHAVTKDAHPGNL